MNPPDQPKDKRSRIARACDLCRRKKVKCHFKPGEPCFNCITYGEKCVFQTETKKRGPPKGYVEELENKLQRTERLIRLKTGRDNVDELLEEADQRARAKKRKHQEDRMLQRRANSPSYRNFTDLDALHSREWPPGISYDSVFYLGDLEGLQFFSHKLPLDENRNVKWKGHFIRKFGDRVVLVADDGKKNPSGSKVPGLQWMEPAARPKGIHQYIYWVAGIDQHTSSRLLKIYFANIHPVLPVINKREFLRQYRDISDAYPTGELLNAMFGAAARFAECEQLDPERLKNIPPDARWDVPVGWSDHFFDQAQNIITKSANHPTISKIQAIVLTHNQRGDIDSKSSACWLMGGLAIRLAQGLGLNRNCDDWDIPDREKQVRKRVWWALYACDRFQSALHGRPLGIRDEDNDVGYPDIHANYNEVMDIPVEDDEDWKGPRFPSCTTIPACTNGQVPIYQLFVQFVKLSEILGRLLQGLYMAKGQERSYQHGSDSLVAQLDQQLTEWRFEFPEALKRANLPDLDEKTGHFAPVVASTLLFYFTSLILLHRPFIRPPPSFENHQNGSSSSNNSRNPSYSSFRICTSAASLGIQLASKMTVYDFLLTPYAFSLYPLLQCCLIHMYNTRNPDLKVSAKAKADLETGVALVNRIHKMSSTAQRLKILLHDVMNNKNIDVTSTPSEIYALHRELANGKRTPDTDQTAVSLDDLLQKQQQCRQRRGEAWLSEFLNPTEALSTISQLPVHPDQEAFTLQQFGFEPISRIEAPVLLTQSAITPSSTSMYSNTNENVSAGQNVGIGNLATLAFAQEPGRNSTEENVFRNNPDNPFWGVPSSFDCTEWTEWNERTENQWLWPTTEES